MPSSHSGTVATSSAASPDGTVFSPTPTTPLATSSKTPTIAQPAHSARPGQRHPSEPEGGGAAWTEERSDQGKRRLKAPRRRPGDTASGNMIRPATRFLAAAISSGGIVSTPTLMARYVLPHTSHTMNKDTHAPTLARRTGPAPSASF